MNNTYLLFGLGIFTVLLFSGCVIPNFVDTNALSTQEAIIALNFDSAAKLLDFQDKSQLESFEPKYQNYSDELALACTKLDNLDRNKNFVTAKTKAICENKEELDKCFFQLEKIKTQIKNDDTDVNLDSLDVLCSNVRSVGLQGRLDVFKSKYTNYTDWLNAERGIIAEWGTLTTLLWNTSSEDQLGEAKISDYYRAYKDSMTDVKVSLQKIKTSCALKNDFDATSSKVEKICGNIDGYLSDLDKTNRVVLETFTFFNKFDVGTTTINSAFILECQQTNEKYTELFDLNLMKDTKLSGSTGGDFGVLCDSLENLSILYSSLGVPLVFEDGKLSSTTRTELFKAKTVYVSTSRAVGSGVIISSDSYGYYILTNAHVALTIDPDTGLKYLPTYLRIKFYGGKVGYATKLAYTQEGYDLVVLYVPSSSMYPIASYSEEYYPSAGDKVVAVGNPYGLEFSVTQGTVSAIRDVGCSEDYCYGIVIQTDTAINPGNSGGGLWDYDSQELVGINSLALTQAEGLNFAISMYQFGQIKDTFKWYTID